MESRGLIPTPPAINTRFRGASVGWGSKKNSPPALSATSESSVHWSKKEKILWSCAARVSDQTSCLGEATRLTLSLYFSRTIRTTCFQFSQSLGLLGLDSTCLACRLLTIPTLEPTQHSYFGIKKGRLASEILPLTSQVRSWANKNGNGPRQAGTLGYAPRTPSSKSYSMFWPRLRNGLPP